jgi:hypothetical protein
VVVASCANTGMASENATAKVNSTAKSFFMLGLDLLMNFFPYLLRARIGPLFSNCIGQRQTTQIPGVMSSPGWAALDDGRSKSIVIHELVCPAHQMEQKKQVQGVRGCSGP